MGCCCYFGLHFFDKHCCGISIYVNAAVVAVAVVAVNDAVVVFFWSSFIVAPHSLGCWLFYSPSFRSPHSCFISSRPSFSASLVCSFFFFWEGVVGLILLFLRLLLLLLLLLLQGVPPALAYAVDLLGCLRGCSRCCCCCCCCWCQCF